MYVLEQTNIDSFAICKWNNLIYILYIYNIPYTITSKFTICTEVNLTISTSPAA